MLCINIWYIGSIWRILMLCIAMHCYALLCIAMHCYALLCIAMHCYALLCIAMHCYALLCIAMHCYAMYTMGSLDCPSAVATCGNCGNPTRLPDPLPGRAEVAFKASCVIASFDCTAWRITDLKQSAYCEAIWLHNWYYTYIIDISYVVDITA